MKIKFIWPFYGPDSKQTAEHHAVHLRDFSQKHKLDAEVGVEGQNHAQHQAYLISDEEYLPLIKNSLRPTQAFRV